MNFLANFAIQSRYKALLVAAILGWLSIRIIPLAIVSAGFGALYTLRKGFLDGLFVFFIAAVITGVISNFVETKPGLDIPVVMFLYLPVFLCSYELSKSQSHGRAVLVAGFCAASLAFSIQLISGDAVVFWSDWLKLAITGIKGATFEGFVQDGTTLVMNGLIAMMLGVGAILSVLLGRYLQAGLYNPGGCQQEFCQLRIPPYALTMSIILILIANLISRHLMYDIVIIAAMIYFFQGLAVVHFSIIKKGLAKGFLLIPYILLLLVPEYAFVGFGLAGLSDALFNFRRLVYPPDQTK